MEEVYDNKIYVSCWAATSSGCSHYYSCKGGSEDIQILYSEYLEDVGFISGDCILFSGGMLKC